MLDEYRESFRSELGQNFVCPIERVVLQDDQAVQEIEVMPNERFDYVRVVSHTTNPDEIQRRRSLRRIGRGPGSAPGDIASGNMATGSAVPPAFVAAWSRLRPVGSPRASAVAVR